ncbi:MAG: hypothetical protein PUF78_06095 [Lachnospiraceae bacterium]|jgi:hypothetical protein|nr:hypothetical protein [Lachnospiraceae bacterium]
MLGMALYAWRTLTNGMILPIMLHFLIDLQPNLLTEDVAAGSFCIYVVIFLPLGLLSFALIYQLEKTLK